MKRILQIMSGNKTFSGVASYLYQQYMYIDRDRVQYDFFFCKENSMELVMKDPVFDSSEFYVLNARTKKTLSTNYVKVMQELEKILNRHQYDAVVVNTSIVAIIFVCMRVVGRHSDIRFIAHAHNARLVLDKGALRRKISPVIKAADNLFRSMIRRKAFALFACSEEAGIVTFGEDCVKLDNFKIVRNAIDINKFKFNPEISKEVREELSVNQEMLVIGNVGKLSKRKNQKFLIHIFSIIHEVEPNSQLWLIGDGEDRVTLELLTQKMGLENAVLFLGEKKDVNRYFQAMNAFVFTTLSEGLGIVAIEAQAAGVPTIVSDGVPDDVLLTQLSEKVSLNSSAEEWARRVVALCKKFPGHPDFSSNLENAGYDIRVEANKMADFYTQL